MHHINRVELLTGNTLMATLKNYGSVGGQLTFEIYSMRVVKEFLVASNLDFINKQWRSISTVSSVIFFNLLRRFSSRQCLTQDHSTRYNMAKNITSIDSSAWAKCYRCNKCCTVSWGVRGDNMCGGERRLWGWYIVLLWVHKKWQTFITESVWFVRLRWSHHLLMGWYNWKIWYQNISTIIIPHHMVE